MSDHPAAPKTFDDFVAQFPDIARAWEMVHEAGKKCSFDAKTARLIKLAISVGAMREGAVRASARKAIAAGISHDELNDVVTLAASTMGFPASVAAFSWIRDAISDTP